MAFAKKLLLPRTLKPLLAVAVLVLTLSLLSWYSIPSADVSGGQAQPERQGQQPKQAQGKPQSAQKQEQHDEAGTGISLENIKHSLEDATRDLLEDHQIRLPCTITNTHNDQFFDLTPLGGLGVDHEVQAWNARGFDYGYNFSIGVCHTPLKQFSSLTELDFKDTSNTTNIGAYYTDKDGHKVSMGQVSTDLKFRGKKIVLEYSNGDICPDLQNGQGEPLRKSTLLSFTCDREMMQKAHVHYLGSFHNCTYHFEVRTIHACATASDASDDAVWLIFAGVVFAALVVYFGAHKVYAITKSHYDYKIRTLSAV